MSMIEDKFQGQSHSHMNQEEEKFNWEIQKAKGEEEKIQEINQRKKQYHQMWSLKSDMFVAAYRSGHE
jgi:hypothetical protein